MEKTKWSYFPKLKTHEEVKEYFDVRTEGHKEFYHYTTLKAINSILRDKMIRISPVSRLNDEKDKKQFGDEKEQKRYFSLCFSSGSNENLSLWYLYSGVDGKGGRIGISYKKLIQIIGDSEFFISEYDYDTNKEIGIKIPLIRDKNFKITYRDVLYSKVGNSDCVDLKYNTMTNHNNVKIAELEKYTQEFVGFNKSLIWYYEKEFRILIKLIGSIESWLEKDKDYAIFLKLTDKQIQQFKITFAPEIEKISDADDNEYIKDFIYKSSRVSLSENAGYIHMNICTKCNKKSDK